MPGKARQRGEPRGWRTWTFWRCCTGDGEGLGSWRWGPTSVSLYTVRSSETEMKLSAPPSMARTQNIRRTPEQTRRKDVGQGQLGATTRTSAGHGTTNSPGGGPSRGAGAAEVACPADAYPCWASVQVRKVLPAMATSNVSPPTLMQCSYGSPVIRDPGKVARVAESPTSPGVCSQGLRGL